MKEQSDSKKLIPLYLKEIFLQKTDKTHFIRMPEILEELDKRGITADRRTIYTNISLLEAVDFHIEGVQEKGNYKYHLPERDFDSNELKILIDSVAASKFLTEKKSRELIKKLKTLGSTFDMVEYSKKAFGMFGGKEETISIEAPNNLAGVFIERFGESARIRPSLEKKDFFVAKITVYTSVQFYEWLFE